MTDTGTSDAFCQVTSSAAGEPMRGTAIVVRNWVILEESGPWAPKTLQSPGIAHLRDKLVEWEEQLAPCRTQLIRRPGVGRVDPARRRLYLAGIDETGASWLERHDLTDEELLSFDVPARFAASTHAPNDERLVLLCTHGKRDRCCSLQGMKLFPELAKRHPGTWQSSHIGGHRFAATAVVLPAGYYLGRLGPEDAAGLAEALGRDALHDTDKVRGRSRYERPTQTAELILRERLGLRGFDEVSHLSTEMVEDKRAIVRLAAIGEEHALEVVMKPFARRLAISCFDSEQMVGHWEEA